MVVIAKRKASHQVVDAVCGMLRGGGYRVGERLPSEQELGAELGVSRSTVREAVRELTALGVLEIQLGRGTFVRSLRPDLLLRGDSLVEEPNDRIREELLEVRGIVEPEAAALAAIRATDEDIERLRYDVERLAEAAGRGMAPPEDLGFHLDLVRATHNAALWRVSGAIISFYQWDGQLPTEQDAVDHRAIYEAVRDHDPSRARQAMRDHLAGPTVAGHTARPAASAPLTREPGAGA
ncbi:MAG: FadR family transcriptional regulator [Chloroflexia bacterium]|nr:FadR family transcriptional regulator [Chloroflexia bacterium]MDQ3410489.1 FCD domain-containing protein [Chloroflexota bacterium]